MLCHSAGDNFFNAFMDSNNYHDIGTVDLNQYLESILFIKSAADTCIYTRIKNQHEITLFIYVDDLLIASRSMEQINEIKLELSAKWSTKDMGEISEILGIEFYRNREQKSSELNQSSYMILDIYFIVEVEQQFGNQRLKLQWPFHLLNQNIWH